MTVFQNVSLWTMGIAFVLALLSFKGSQGRDESAYFFVAIHFLSLFVFFVFIPICAKAFLGWGAVAWGIIAASILGFFYHNKFLN